MKDLFIRNFEWEFLDEELSINKLNTDACNISNDSTINISRDDEFMLYAELIGDVNSLSNNELPNGALIPTFDINGQFLNCYKASLKHCFINSVLYNNPLRIAFGKPEKEKVYTQEFEIESLKKCEGKYLIERYLNGMSSPFLFPHTLTTDKVQERKRVYIFNNQEKIEEIYSTLPCSATRQCLQIELEEFSFVIRDIDDDFTPSWCKPLAIEYRKDWIEHIVIPKSATTTVYGYNNIIRNYIKPQLGKTKLQKLTPKEVQEYISWLMYEKKLSANTAIKHYEMLKNTLGVAEKQDYIVKNPIDRVERPKKIKTEASFYTSEQLAELLTLVQDHRLELPVRLAAHFGLRRGEICGLRWQDIDFDNRVIDICNTRTSAGSTVVEKDTKNESSTRKLSMPDTICTLLNKEKEKQENLKKELGEVYIDTDFVVVMDGGKPYRPNYLSELFTNFLKKNNLPKIVLHELRHTFASLSNEAGIPEFNIGKALGHSHPSTTKKIYTHLFDEKHTTAVDSVAGILDNAVDQKKREQDERLERINTLVPKVIIEWNPIGLSENELDYNDEIDAIKQYMFDGGQELGQFIFDTFRDSFGKRFFKATLSECEKIADAM